MGPETKNKLQKLSSFIEEWSNQNSHLDIKDYCGFVNKCIKDTTSYLDQQKRYKYANQQIEKNQPVVPLEGIHNIHKLVLEAASQMRSNPLLQNSQREHVSLQYEAQLIGLLQFLQKVLVEEKDIVEGWVDDYEKQFNEYLENSKDLSGKALDEEQRKVIEKVECFFSRHHLNEKPANVRTLTHAKCLLVYNLAVHYMDHTGRKNLNRQMSERKGMKNPFDSLVNGSFESINDNITQNALRSCKEKNNLKLMERLDL